MDTTELATTTQPEELSLVALSPGDVPAQQQRLVEWCAQKVKALAGERSDLLDSARIAKSNNWSFLSLERLAKKTEMRMQYYEKIGAAASEGYLIVPNFEVEVMAVRVKRDAPIRVTCSDSDTAGEAKAELLPVGEGRYVDDRAYTYTQHVPTGEKYNDGTPKTTAEHWPLSYDEHPDFPVLAVKPVILEATAHAMARKIFDRIGVVTGRQEDPIVVGQIIDPRQRGSRWQRPKVVSFFIAWWFDTKSL